MGTESNNTKALVKKNSSKKQPPNFSKVKTAVHLTFLNPNKAAACSSARSSPPDRTGLAHSPGVHSLQPVPYHHVQHQGISRGVFF